MTVQPGIIQPRRWFVLEINPGFAPMHAVKRLVLLAAALAGLSGCTTVGNGWYGGADFGPGVYGPVGYGPVGFGAGWFNDWYYPGTGVFVYDRWGGRRGWTPYEQAYWRERRIDRREFRADRRQDRQAWRAERRADRQAYRSGQIDRQTFRADRRQDRREARVERWRDRADYRQDRRQDRRDFRRGAPIRRR
jgi:hypothetical protein